jgi:3,4-dihydroxy 2-butanone 4-phosphate synthase/GTP cyclohydrolase II
MPFGNIERAIADIRAGKLVIVADDEARENEGDLVGAASGSGPMDASWPPMGVA